MQEKGIRAERDSVEDYPLQKSRILFAGAVHEAAGWEHSLVRRIIIAANKKLNFMMQKGFLQVDGKRKCKRQGVVCCCDHILGYFISSVRTSRLVVCWWQLLFPIS